MQMKRSYLLVITGGLLAAVAFFLPFFVTPRTGIFGPGDSLQSTFLDSLRLLYGESVSLFQMVMTLLIIVLEPLGAILLLASGLLVPRLGRSLYAWGLSGAVLSLTFLLWYLSLLYGVYTAFQPGISVGYVLSYFGIGYWLAVIGGVLGVLGVLLGWLNDPAQTAVPMQPLAGSVRRYAPLNRAGAALELCACLLLIVGCFLPSFTPVQRESLIDLLKLPNGYFILWPALLAIVLLLAGGLFAFTGRKGAHLVSLSGALIGLFLVVAFLSRLLPGFGNTFFEAHVSVAFWVTVGGCLVGLVGAVVGLLARPAAPMPAEALASPVPF
jgi:hypothetical protein